MGSGVLAAGMADIKYADWTGDTDGISCCCRKKIGSITSGDTFLEHSSTFHRKNHGRLFAWGTGRNRYGSIDFPAQKGRRTVLSHGLCDEIHTGSVCDYPAVNVDVFRKFVCRHCISDDISHPLYECTGRIAADGSEADRAGRSI